MLHIDPRASALGLVASTVVVEQLNNREYSNSLANWMKEQYACLQQESAQAAGDRASAIDGLHRIRRVQGRSWQRFPASPAVLWQQFQRRGELVRINPAVDIYNLLSLQTGLSLGGHDSETLSGEVQLTLCAGGETFLALGSDRAVTLPEGEFVYRDDSAILCRMDCRQADVSKLSAGSHRAVFIVQGHRWIDQRKILDCRDRLAILLEQFCSAKIR